MKLHLQLIVLFVFSFISREALGQSAPSANLNGTDLKTWLKTNWYTGRCNVLSYASARQRMYSSIDNKNGWVYCVYTGFREVAGTTLDTINCEHSIPQSLFNSNSPMVSDIHHLYPANMTANSVRSNYKLTNIPDNVTTQWLIGNQTSSNGLTTQSSIPTVNKDGYAEYTTVNPNRFEPREVHKGNVARAIFYFFTMYDLTSYGNSLSTIADLDTLYKWHLQDPVDADEIARNNATETAQGNRNPYIDYPDLVARAYGFTVATCSAPTTQGSAISWTVTGSTTATINLTAGNGSNRIIVVKQGSDITSPTISNGTSYTASSTFGTGNTVGTGNYVVYNGSSNSVSITGLASGQTYYARVYEYNCTTTSTVYLTTNSGGPFSATTTSCIAPTTQTSSIVSGGSTSTTLTLNWTNGNGSNRIVVARQGSAVTAVPTNGTTYTANATFGSGTAISAGQTVVYAGSGNTATITGLTANTSYSFAIYEYNCSGTNSIYSTTLAAGNQYTASTQVASSGSAADLIISEYVEGTSNNKYIEIYNGTTTSATLSNYQLRLFANGGVTATSSLTLSGTLAPGGTIVYANTAATIYTGTVTTTAVANYNGNDAIGLYNTVTASYADIFGVIGVDPGASGWTATGGYQTTDRTIRRKATACNGVTVNPSGTGSGSFTTLATDWDVFTTDVIIGLGSHTASCGATSCSTPTLAASTALLKNASASTARVRWLRGNGTGGVIVLMAAGSSITGMPTSGTTYTSNADITNAGSSTISGAKVVYIGTDTAVAITGLSASTQYAFSVFEYNTTGTCFTASAATGTGYTLAAKPSAYPASITASTVSSTSITLNFSAASTITNALGYLVLQKTGSSTITAQPTNGVSYTAGTTIGDAAIISVITNTATTSLSLTGLTANTQYQYTIVPYNSDAGNTAATFQYNNDVSRPSATAFAAAAGISYTVSGQICSNTGTVSTAISVTTTSGVTLNAGNNYVIELSDAAGSFTSATNLATVSSTSSSVVTSVNVPTSSISGTGYIIRVRTTNPVLASSSGSSFEIVNTPQLVSFYGGSAGNASASATWTNPSTCLTGVLVVAKASSSVTVTPTGDGTAYTAVSDITGAGTSFGGGKVVYKGTGSSATITGLTNGTTYYLKIFTYTGSSWSAGQEINVLPTNGSVAPSSGDIVFTQVEHQLTGTELLISEYCEDGAQKYLEIYNPTNGTITASNYGIRLFSNGSSSPSTAALSGTIAPNNTLIVRNSGSSSSPNSQTTAVNSSVNYNGDDAVGIYTTGGTIVDLFGNIGCDPGSDWTGTTNNTSTITLRRKSSSLSRVTTDPSNTGNSQSGCPFPTLDTDWEKFTSTNYTGLGYHKMEVAQRTLVEFVTLKTMNLNGLNITDRGLCSGGRFFNKAGDNVYTLPSSGLENVPEGTFVRIKWNMAGTDELDASDGVITLYANITETTQNRSTGDQLIAFTGTPTVVTTCATGSSADTKIAGFHFGENDWKTSDANVLDQDDSFAPGTGSDFSLPSLKNFTDWRFNGIVSGAANTIVSTASGVRKATNWTYDNAGNNRAKLKDIKFNTSAYSSGAVVVSNRTQTSFKIDWSAVSFTNSTVNTRYIVVVSQGSNPDQPVDRYTVYSTVSGNFATANNVITSLTGTADSLLSQLTATAGNGKVVHIGSATNVTITGLSEKTSYTYSIHAFNGNGYTSAFSAAHASLRAAVLTTTAEISVSYNANAVTNGGNISPSAITSGTTQDLQFTISNTGEATLNITAGSLSNANFAFVGSPIQTVNAGASRIYTVRYSPIVSGSEVCTLSLSTSDLTDAVFTVVISSTALSSSGSTIVVLGTGYSYNIPYINYQASTITTVANSVQVMSLNLIDGDGLVNDIDNLSTKLASLDFSFNDLDAIRTAALFDGNTLISNTFTRNSSTAKISFSGLQSVPFDIADNSQRSIQLRVTFTDLVTDNESIVVTLNAITIAGSSSAFIPNVATNVISPNLENLNKLIVTADRLNINSVNQVIEPCQVKLSLAISATDALGVIDNDVNQALTLSYGTAAQSNVNSTSLSLASGFASLNDAIVYRNFAGTFSAQYGAVTGSKAVVVTGVNCNRVLYKRTRQDGAWTGTGVWESVLDNGGTVISNEGFYGSSPNNDTVQVIIAHNMTLSTAVNAGKLTIEKNKSLTGNGIITVNGDILVDSNSTFTLNSPLILNSSTQNFIVNSGGQVVINHPYGGYTLASSLWKGIENFKAGSKLVVKQFPANQTLVSGITPQIISGTTRYLDQLELQGSFSNLIIGDSAIPVARTIVLNTTGDTVHLSKNDIAYDLDSLVITNGHLALIDGKSSTTPTFKYLTIGDGANSAIFQTTPSNGNALKSKQIIKTQYLTIANNANYNQQGTTQLINTGTLSIGNGTNKLNLEILGNTTAHSNLPTSNDDTIQVKTGGTLLLTSQNITGTGYLNLNDNSSIYTGHAAGYGDVAGTTGALQISNKVLSTNAIYGFSGSIDQNAGLGLPSTVKGLIVNKSAGKVRLSKNQTATTSLSLLQGKLFANDFSVTVGTSGSTGIVEQGSDTVNSYIALKRNGLLKVYSNNSKDLISFPVGDSLLYSPMRIQFNSATMNGSAFLTAQVIDSIMPYIRNQGSAGQNYLTRYWKVEPSGITGFNYSASITVPATEVIGSYSTMKLCKWNSNSGFKKSGILTPTGLTNSNYLNLSWNAITSFSDFSGAGDELLPVTLVSFKASATKGKAWLTWTTASEINNDRFVIQRSKDGISFDSIGFVKGHGNSAVYLNYEYADYEFSGNNWYRLKQVDFNGSYTYSPANQVTISESNGTWNVYPNPSSSTFNLSRAQLPDWLKVEIINVLGNSIYNAIGNPESVLSEFSKTSFSSIPTGLYYIKIQADDEPLQFKKVVKQ